MCFALPACVAQPDRNQPSDLVAEFVAVYGRQKLEVRVDLLPIPKRTVAFYQQVDDRNLAGVVQTEVRALDLQTRFAKLSTAPA